MCDFLPESVHNFLNNVESSLSLPVLIIIILCTLQFVLYHSMHIICVLTEIFRKNAAKKPKKKTCPPRKKQGPGMLQRLQKSLCAWVGVGEMNGKGGCKKRKPSCKHAPARTPKKSDDDDDFDDDCDFDDDL